MEIYLYYTKVKNTVYTQIYMKKFLEIYSLSVIYKENFRELSHCSIFL